VSFNHPTNPDRRAVTEAASDHPGDETLRALFLDRLAEADLARVSAHLDACPACCQRIDQLAQDDHLLARLQQGTSNQDEVLISQAQLSSAVRALRRSDPSGSTAGKRDAEAALVSHLPLPKQVGDYEILAEVGRGGMGVVYKACHKRLRRPAALKMILAGEFASPTQELRFRLEAELAARVQHPNIVQVYEISSYEGRPFLALEWVDGGSLANRLDGSPWPPSEAASLIETLARAIDVAHAEGVVHRDLKPANILLAVASGAGRAGGVSPLSDGWTVDGNGCRQVDTNHTPPITVHSPPSTVRPSEDRGLTPAARPGDTNHTPPITVHSLQSTVHPKITDFGLARPLEAGETMTQTGFLVGTPGYMAPEQAAGKRALVGPATDIYALGVMLYQLLTGQLPFEHESTLELLRAVMSEEPPRPSRLEPRLPRDLEAITLHCLEKEPSKRYASALALAEDLRRFRNGEPVTARPVGAPARLARACRRRPLVALLVALLAVSLCGGLGGVTWKWLEADKQRDLANGNARRANDEKQAAQYQTYRASLAAAGAALRYHDVADAARNLELAPNVMRGWEWKHMQSRLDESSGMGPLPTGESFLIAAPDQVRIGVLASDGVRVTDLEGREEKTVPIDPKRMRSISVAQTDRGLRVVAWVDSAAFDLLDDAGQIVCRVVRPNNNTHETVHVAVSPDGTRLAVQTGYDRNQLAVFDATSGKQTAICKGHVEGLFTYAFSPDSTRLATCSSDRTARVWDAATGALLATCQGHASTVQGVTFSPDGTRLLTASADGRVGQWDARIGRLVAPFYDRHTSLLFSAAYSPDGRWIASAGEDRVIRVWQARDGQDMAILHGHTGHVREVAFAPDGRRLVSRSMPQAGVAAAETTVRVWDVDPQAPLPALRGHKGSIDALAYSPDGRWLASGSSDRTVRLWDAATGLACATLPHDDFVSGLAFGPEGKWLLTGDCHSGLLRIWDVVTARVRKQIRVHDGNLRFGSMAVSPDATRVAANSEDKDFKNQRLTVYDIASGKPLYSAEGVALAYSPDGRWLAVRAPDATTVLLLDARTHETIARFSGHKKNVLKASFSPDSRRLASCSEDQTIRMWQIGSGACRVLSGHTDIVYAVAFHSDGTRLATAARDGAVWLWDVERGADLARLAAHEGFVSSLAFSRDGATLASGSGDATIRLWDTAPLKARYQARRKAEALRPEAERLVERLWRQKKDPTEVAEALRADPGLSEPLRHAAQLAVLRRTNPQEKEK
jgi:WD40 repeat protein/serine/threonine protein kinase